MAKEKSSLIEQFDALLLEIGLQLRKYDQSKARPVTLTGHTAMTVDKFCLFLRDQARGELFKYQDLSQTVFDSVAMDRLLHDYSKKKLRLVEQIAIEVPEHYKTLTLNLDQSHTGRDMRFFMTTPNEFVSEVSGTVYTRVMGLKDVEALSLARKVVPQYRPRSKPGVVRVRNVGEETMEVYNSYIPPSWMRYGGELPDKLPPLFERLVKHLIPSKLEQEYFYAWLYASLFRRSYVYLILCGPGGTGKNRLKLVMRALHGHQNTVDGKRSTLTERFNSQLSECTLAWFDELHYDQEMENFMKEVQNDTISIEKKGVDATRSTKIFSSNVISNNKPRDNFIAFDARKFAPLQVTKVRLDHLMTNAEIGELTRKVESWTSKHFDVKFLAQIGRWVEKHGPALMKKWPHLEYKGPMFYKLAHTSMSRWQKKAASVMISGAGLNSARIVMDEEKGYLWSTVADATMKKNGDRSLQFPDYSTVRHFFDIFVDGKGRKTFETKTVPGDIMGDFYVKIINKKAMILTEAEVNQEVTGYEGSETEVDVEEYDL